MNMHCMYLERKMVTEKKKPKKDGPDMEVSSPWFKLKLEDIDYKTMIVIGMLILGAISIIGMLV